MKYSLRDAMWLTLVFAVCLGWCVDHLTGERSHAALDRKHEADLERMKAAETRQRAMSQVLREKLFAYGVNVRVGEDVAHGWMIDFEEEREDCGYAACFMHGKAIDSVADSWGQAIDPRHAFPQKFPVDLDDCQLQQPDLSEWFRPGE
jgi:hypothetical protein